MTRLLNILALVLFLAAPAFAQSAPEQSASADVALTEEALERYVGGYELQPGVILSVMRDGDSLFAGVSGQLPYEMVATSETEFTVQAIGARITFNRAEDGTTESLTLQQNGVEMMAVRAE